MREDGKNLLKIYLNIQREGHGHFKEHLFTVKYSYDYNRTSKRIAGI